MARKKKPTEHITTTIARRIRTKVMCAGPHVRATAERHMKDLKRSDLAFSHKAADHAIDFFEKTLKLHEGQFAGQPFLLHPIQKFIIGSIFGWMIAVLDEDGKPYWERRFRRAYIEMGKGNGKTPMGAGIALYGLLADNEHGAEIYAVASIKEQANILFQDAVNMRAAAPAIAEVTTPSGKFPVWQITYEAAGSKFKPLSRETSTKGSGPRPHFALVDELHEMVDGGILQTVERGFKSRRQPMLVMFTNSGTDRDSVCFEEHTLAIGVANGTKTDDRLFSFVCALDEGDDPLTDESCWEKVNPLLGSVIKHDYLRGVVLQARNTISRRNTIMRLHFCTWTDSHTAWIGREILEKAEKKSAGWEDYEGQQCFLGLDLARRFDIFGVALAVYGEPNKKGKRNWTLLTSGYIPLDNLDERVKKDHTPYDLWVQEGNIIGIDGPAIDYDQVADDLAKILGLYNVTAVIVDPWNYEALKRALDERLPYAPEVHFHPQGWNKSAKSELTMPLSLDNFEEQLLCNRLKIAPNPAFKAGVANMAILEATSKQRRPDKAKATGRKILQWRLLWPSAVARPCSIQRIRQALTTLTPITR